MISGIARERLLKAMNHQKPDLVPIMCQFSIGFMLRQLSVSPSEFWFDAEIFMDGLLRLREKFDFDGILVSLHGHDPHWRDKVKYLKADRETDVLEYNGGRMIFPNGDLPRAAHYSRYLNTNIDKINVNDIPEVITYIPVSQGLRFEICENHRFDIFEMIRKGTKGNFSVHGEITSPFDYFLDCLGHENALMAMLENPDKSRLILQKFTDGLCKLASDMASSDVDAIKISSPFAGMGFISPEQYREFVSPYESQLICCIHDKTKKAYLHTCGSIGDRLELMVGSGADGIECLDPPPIGNVEIEDAFKRIGDQMFIKGNIDPVNVLLNGNKNLIKNETLRLLRASMRKGGFILSTACSIAPETPAENVLELSKLVKEHGIYP